MRGLWNFFWSLLSLSIALCLWLVLSTELVLRPIAVRYEGQRMTFMREVPFGEVTADWTIEFRMGDRFPDCYRSGTTGYEPTETNVTTTVLGDWARPCLEAGPPLVVVNTWQAQLFGLIPLRPVRLVSVLPPDVGN